MADEIYIEVAADTPIVLLGSGYGGTIYVEENAAVELFYPWPEACPPVGGDTTPPVIDSYVPSPGTEIQTDDPLQFDVTDNLAEFRRIIIEAFFQSTGQSEVVHDGDTFRPYYSGGSTRTIVQLGYRYVLNRLGGWPASPTIRVYAIDQDGNEGE
jgi:hypothetical protein